MDAQILQMQSQIKTTLPTKEENLHMQEDKGNYNIDSYMEETLSAQNKNLQSQIKVLNNKIQYYENEYHNKNAKMSNDIQILGAKESKLKSLLEEKEKVILQYEKENKFLKQNLSDMENTVLEFKNEVKELAKNITYTSNKEKTNEMINLIKEYSNEIAKLRQENTSLNKELGKYTNSKNHQCPIHSEYNDYNDISDYVNNELFIITQWVQTYLSNCYDKNYEVPSLFNQIKNMNDYSFSFDSLKSALEVSRENINSILNAQEAKASEMRSLLQNEEKKNIYLSKELVNLKTKAYESAENQLIMNKKLEEHQKRAMDAEENIQKLSNSREVKENDYNVFLNKMYSYFQGEITSILNDENFKAFHTTLLTIPISQPNNSNIQNVKMLLISCIERFMEFFAEIKYDYIQTKKDNVKLIKNSNDNLVGKSEKDKAMEFELMQMQREISKKDDLIHELESEKSMLKNQIELFEKGNEVQKESEKELQSSYQKMTEKFEEMEKLYRNTKKDMEIYKEKCEMMEKKAQRNDIIINEYKIQSENAMKLELENKKMKEDYTRIVNENNILRTLNQKSVSENN